MQSVPFEKLKLHALLPGGGILYNFAGKQTEIRAIMALSKKELEKTKELARLYYLSGDTQKMQALCQELLEEILHSFDGDLCIIQIQL